MLKWLANTAIFAGVATMFADKGKRMAKRDTDRFLNNFDNRLDYENDDPSGMTFNMPEIGGFWATMIFLALVAVVWMSSAFVINTGRDLYLTAFTDRQPLPANYQMIMNTSVELSDVQFSEVCRGCDMGQMSVTVTNTSDHPIDHINVICTVVGTMGANTPTNFELAGQPGNSTRTRTFEIEDPYGKALESNCHIDEVSSVYTRWSGLPRGV
jgi:hypothetical protein